MKGCHSGGWLGTTLSLTSFQVQPLDDNGFSHSGLIQVYWSSDVMLILSSWRYSHHPHWISWASMPAVSSSSIQFSTQVTLEIPSGILVDLQLPAWKGSGLPWILCEISIQAICMLLNTSTISRQHHRMPQMWTIFGQMDEAPEKWIIQRSSSKLTFEDCFGSPASWRPWQCFSAVSIQHHTAFLSSHAFCHARFQSLPAVLLNIVLPSKTEWFRQ